MPCKGRFRISSDFQVKPSVTDAHSLRIEWFWLDLQSDGTIWGEWRFDFDVGSRNNLDEEAYYRFLCVIQQLLVDTIYVD